MFLCKADVSYRLDRKGAQLPARGDHDRKSPVPHFKVAPEEFVKLQFQRFTTLNLHPSNTDISVAVAGILNFFNCTTACLICAKAESYRRLLYLHQNVHAQGGQTESVSICTFSLCSADLQ
ncbi:UNVERIFIED_CONTAM: hypothetical protein K2H54_013820 [Gekko kuhli]